MSAPLPPSTEDTARLILDSAFSVHRELGPGLVENAYEACLAYELSRHRVEFARQLRVPLSYRGVLLDASVRLDLVVARCVVVEVKATDAPAPVHKFQLLTYLRFSAMRLGLLLNFNVPLLRDGITRVIL